MPKTPSEPPLGLSQDEWNDFIASEIAQEVTDEQIEPEYDGG